MDNYYRTTNTVCGPWDSYRTTAMTFSAAFITSFPFTFASPCHTQTRRLGPGKSSFRPSFPSFRISCVPRVQTGRGGCTDNMHLNVTMSDENAADDEERTNPSSWQFAYILTTLASLLAGGRTLPIFSGLFLGIARAVEAPLWLTAFSSVVSSALIDVLIFRVASPSSVPGLPYPISLQEGVPPYAVFFIGCIITAAFDFDGFFQTRSPGTKDLQDPKRTIQEASDDPKITKVDELGSWDMKMGRRSDKEK